MIECFSIATEHLFGDVRYAMHRFRYQHFFINQKYDVPHFNRMEFDDFDTPATTYLVKRNEHGKVLGTSRFLPTNFRYMLEFWPKLLDEPPPKLPEIWESSRFGIEAPKNQRERIKNELLLAKLEYGLSNGIQSFIGIMAPNIWKSVFIKNGWPVSWLGPESTLEKWEYSVRAGRLQVNETVYKNVRAVTGINDPVLSMVPVI